jgi:glycosyltransferase involved in cell wall biosynthesis
MKKILIIIPTIKIGGGAEKVASTLGVALNDRKEYNVKLLTFYSRKKEYAFAGERFSINEKLSGFRFLKLWKRAFYIKKICKENNIETAISFIEEANFSLIISKIFINKARLIVSVRNNPANNRKSIFYKVLIFFLYRFAFKVVTNSRGSEIILNRKFKLKNTIAIYNNHDIKKYKILSKKSIKNIYKNLFNNKKFVFINIGRLSDQKGHFYLINAFKKIVSEFEYANLIIIGDGDKKKKLKNLVESMGMENNVVFIDRIYNVLPFLKKSDCFVLSSIREGLPNVVIEALSCNLPVIATDCKTGPREILSPDIEINEDIKYPFKAKYGFLVKPFYLNNNNKEAKKILIDAMRELIKNKTIREKYSSISQERARYFDENKIVKEWEKII